MWFWNSCPNYMIYVGKGKRNPVQSTVGKRREKTLSTKGHNPKIPMSRKPKSIKQPGTQHRQLLLIQDLAKELWTLKKANTNPCHCQMILSCSPYVCKRMFHSNIYYIIIQKRNLQVQTIFHVTEIRDCLRAKWYLQRVRSQICEYF